MYLFIYGDDKYFLTEAQTINEAIVKLYEHNGVRNISLPLFKSLVTFARTEEAVELFNALMPDNYAIKDVFSGIYRYEIKGLNVEGEDG